MRKPLPVLRLHLSLICLDGFVFRGLDGELPARRELQTSKNFLEENEVVLSELDALVHGQSVFGVECVESTVARLVNRADKIRDWGNAVFQPAVVGSPRLLADLVAPGAFPLKVLQGNKRNPRPEQIDRLPPTTCAPRDRHVI